MVLKKYDQLTKTRGDKPVMAIDKRFGVRFTMCKFIIKVSLTETSANQQVKNRQSTLAN